MAADDVRRVCHAPSRVVAGATPSKETEDGRIILIVVMEVHATERLIWPIAYSYLAYKNQD